jgi:non-ribosomal peptide synthetase component F
VPYITDKWDFDARLATTDPWLTLQEEADGLSASVSYRSDRFEPGSMERLLSNLQRFMERFLEQPQVPLSEMPYE